MAKSVRVVRQSRTFLLSLPQNFSKYAGRIFGDLLIYGRFFMKKILDYIKSVRSEWFKIVWPSRDSVIRATIMILVFSGVAALFFFVVDSILNALVGWIF